MQNSFVHTSNIYYSPLQKTYQKERKKTPNKTYQAEVHITKTRLVVQTLPVQVILRQR